jgi:hypothetical protein
MNINENGKKQIASYLKQYHKLGNRIYHDVNVLDAYARVVELHLDQGEEPYFYLYNQHTKDGRYKYCLIDKNGVS